jgi:threonine/homoserine/homoserine lactone efflux protein
MNALLAFVAVAAVVIVTPGQDTALVVKNTLAGRRRAGVATALGVSTGQLAWTLATSAGLAAVLVASEQLFLAIRLVGAAYLTYLGVAALWSALRRRSHAHAVASPSSLGRGPAFRQGALSNLGNPKMAVFFTSLLPQFAGSGAGFLDLLALGVLFAVLTVACSRPTPSRSTAPRASSAARSCGARSTPSPASCSSRWASASPPSR